MQDARIHTLCWFLHFLKTLQNTFSGPSRASDELASFLSLRSIDSQHLCNAKVLAAKFKASGSVVINYSVFNNNQL